MHISRPAVIGQTTVFETPVRRRALCSTQEISTLDFAAIGRKVTVTITSLAINVAVRRHDLRHSVSERVRQRSMERSSIIYFELQ